ncbi:hypothetical protein B0T25DRAFT_520442 [Lasiosphaeria hispida]|uniref:Glycosyltransferase 2-like domain-containing protein n=1 Tax=Lasiosphaeria hispida TaxID=260671 RepID=A0AAJ0MAJ4_9PEZI|nr:hypothetical protein B0T25DRAFT_520442 [Lasiosphaeria hispida]
MYKPMPTAAKPTFNTRSVSVISPVLSPEPSLLHCLESYLVNDPLEILLITRVSHEANLKAALGGAWFDTTKVRIIIADDSMPGMRGQIATGFLQARGAITAKVDSHVLWGPSYLANLLPCFEDPTVGTATGAFSTRIAPYRQNRDSITPAEVSSTRAVFGSLRTAKVDAFAAYCWRWIVCGASYLVRTAPVQRPAFTQAFLYDVWYGPFGRHTRLDTGDDTFLSR